MVQVLLWLSVLVPWVILFVFFKGETIRRFLPAGLFGALVLTIVFQLAEQRHWWFIKETIYPLTNTTPFVYGLFIVGTVIILRFTFRKFLLYLAAEVVINLFLAYIGNAIFISLGLFTLTASKFFVFLLTMGVGLLIYFFQIWYAKRNR